MHSRAPLASSWLPYVTHEPSDSSLTFRPDFPNRRYIMPRMINVLLLAFCQAPLLMKRIGRRKGFFVGASFGLAGSVTTTAAILTASFPLLCTGTFLFGIYNAFGQYYRFAAADVAAPADRPRAISYVMA